MLQLLRFGEVGYLDQSAASSAALFSGVTRNDEVRTLPSRRAVARFHPSVREADLGVDAGAVDQSRILDLLEQVMDSDAAADGAGHVRVLFQQPVQQIEVVLDFVRPLQHAVVFPPFRLWRFFIELFYV